MSDSDAKIKSSPPGSTINAGFQVSANNDWNWRAVLASALGMGFSQASIVVLSFGVFIYPLSAEFGWSRTQISFGLTISTLTLAAVTPVFGNLLDKYGFNRVLLISSCLFALCFAAMALQHGNIIEFYIFMALLPLLGAGTNSLTHTRTISQRFTRKLGLALGIAMSGVGVVSMIIPPVGQFLVENLSWRYTYLFFAAAVLIVQLCAVCILHFEKKIPLEDDGNSSENEADISATASENIQIRVFLALCRDQNFLVLTAIFLVLSTAITATNVHLLPLLLDRGIESQSSAHVVSFVGLGLVIGRILAGVLMDYFFAPHIALTLFALTAVGMIGIFADLSLIGLYLSAFVIGLGSATEMDLMAFMTARYFDPQHYGKIYGFFFLCFMIGASVGPLVMGMSFEYYGDYQIPMLINTVMVIMAALLTLFLGKYSSR